MEMAFQLILSFLIHHVSSVSVRLFSCRAAVNRMHVNVHIVWTQARAEKKKRQIKKKYMMPETKFGTKTNTRRKLKTTSCLQAETVCMVARCAKTWPKRFNDCQAIGASEHKQIHTMPKIKNTLASELMKAKTAKNNNNRNQDSGKW